MITPLAIAHAYLLAADQATAQTALTLAQRAIRPPSAPAARPRPGLLGSVAPEAHQPLTEPHEHRPHEG